MYNRSKKNILTFWLEELLPLDEFCRCVSMETGQKQKQGVLSVSPPVLRRTVGRGCPKSIILWTGFLCPLNQHLISSVFLSFRWWHWLYWALFGKVPRGEPFFAVLITWSWNCSQSTFGKTYSCYVWTSSMEWIHAMAKNYKTHRAHLQFKGIMTHSQEFHLCFKMHGIP